MRETFHVKLMGVRGTLPVHGSDYALFGGATSCVLVRAADTTIILDAGTGLNGISLAPGEDFALLITHAHADHLLGFPVFAPLFNPACTAHIYLQTREGRTARAQIEALMAPPLWPVGTEAMAARLHFHDVPERFDIGSVQVRTMPSRHPGGSTLYRLDFAGKSLVYATDFEPDEAAAAAFQDFAADCSLLLLDGQYTEAEYRRCRGFGHAAMADSARLAIRCRAKQTLLIHHDPSHTDAQLLAWEKALQADCLGIRFGREREDILL